MPVEAQQDLPEEFLNRMRRMLGDDFDKFYKSYGEPPFAGLRVNLLKISAEKFLKEAPFSLSPTPFAPEGFYLEKPVSGRHPWHHAGLFYLQEPSAMAVVAAAKIAPGMNILDLCAAPGGKSTQAAARLNGKGILVSNEIIPSRAKILLSNLERMGARNFAVTCEKPETICDKLRGCFDVVLVDAPCSGEGMFRREPRAAREWTPASPPACAKRQAEILKSARQAVKQGGVLVYSTCTFSPEEDEGTVDIFLKENPDFSIEKIDCPFGRPAVPEWADASPELAKARRIFPADGGEGHFIARLRRHSPNPCRVKLSAPGIPAREQQIFTDFYRSQFQQEPYGRLSFSGGRVSILPESMPNLEGLRVLRAGVLAGRVKGKRFEPEHALYMAARNGDFRNVCDFALDSPQTAAFLRGEVLPAPSELAKGYCAVLAQGHAAGFGKVSEGVVKNHYPKGLRNQ